MTGECGLNYNNNRVLTRLSRINFAFGFTDKKCALKIYFLMLKPCKMICSNSDSADCCKQWLCFCSYQKIFKITIWSKKISHCYSSKYLEQFSKHNFKANLAFTASHNWPVLHGFYIVPDPLFPW